MPSSPYHEPAEGLQSSTGLGDCGFARSELEPTVLRRARAVAKALSVAASLTEAINGSGPCVGALGSWDLGPCTLTVTDRVTRVWSIWSHPGPWTGMNADEHKIHWCGTAVANAAFS